MPDPPSEPLSGAADTFALKRTPRLREDSEPHPWEGFLLVGLCAVLFTLIAPLARTGGLPARFLLVPLLAVLLPALLWARVRGGLQETFPSARPGPRTLWVAAALAVGGSLVALGLAGLLTGLFGPQGDEAAQRTLLLSVGPGWRLLYFVLAPALCEEALFRGAFLRALKPWGPGAASLCSALAFAAMHASPIKFLPVAILGWALAQVVLRTGNFWLAVVGHALHNAAVLAMLSAGLGEQGTLGWSLVLPAVVGASAIWLAMGRRMDGLRGA